MNPIRLCYDEQRYPTADACLLGIETRVRAGWQISEICSLKRGYSVTYRVETEVAPIGDPPALHPGRLT